jgi:hypothetical protein
MLTRNQRTSQLRQPRHQSGPTNTSPGSVSRPHASGPDGPLALTGSLRLRALRVRAQSEASGCAVQCAQDPEPSLAGARPPTGRGPSKDTPGLVSDRSASPSECHWHGLGEAARGTQPQGPV